MKNIFNQYERAQHIILIGMQEQLKKMQNCDAITEEEKTYLKYAATYLTKFNDSVIERFGDSYSRKIYNTMQSNDLRLVGKYESYNECVGQCVVDDVKPCIDQLQMMNCFGCEKCDYKKCAVYNLCITCDIDGNNDEGCPFKLN
jgi:hypothetical protein